MRSAISGLPHSLAVTSVPAHQDAVTRFQARGRVPRATIKGVNAFNANCLNLFYDLNSSRRRVNVSLESVGELCIRNCGG